MLIKRTRGQGGPQAQAAHVLRAMQRTGVPASVLTQGRHSDASAAGWTSGLPTTALPGGNQWRFAMQLYRHLCATRDEYDIVHVHGFGLESFAATAARQRTGRPVVVKLTTVGPGSKSHAYGRWTRLFPFVLQPAWRAVDAWISLSTAARDDLLRMGVAPERIAYVPNGVDTRLFHPLAPAERAAARAELGLAPDDVLLLSVTRLISHKRADLLIRAVLELAPQFPRLRLWLVGDGELRPHLEALAAASPHRNAVRFCGRLKTKDVARTMQAADAFALLSQREGLSNATLEAMACGLPVVASAVSGMADLIRPGESGHLVPPDSEAAARKALAMVLQDAEARQRMGMAGLATVRKEFTLERTVERLISLYADLCPPPR